MNGSAGRKKLEPFFEKTRMFKLLGNQIILSGGVGRRSWVGVVAGGFARFDAKHQSRVKSERKLPANL
jgi:hypothetical protein